MKASFITYTKFAIVLFASLAAIDAQAQGIKESASNYPGETARATWSLDASKQSTYLSTRDIATPRWFLITELGPSADSSIELIVDGKTTNYPVNFGGSALVWGKTILAKNYSGKLGHLGQWVLIDPIGLQKIDVAWSIFPETNHEAIAGSFDTKREFIVYFSPDVHVGDCKGARIKPIVDDKPIPDENGNDLFLYPYGSVIAIGRTVRLSAEGTCKSGTSLNGSIKLL
jgi:hypothetical protein